MKNIKVLLIILSAALFFTACEKDETPEVFDTISGVLTVGENLNSSDFGEIGIILLKLEDGIDPATVNSETEEIEVIETISVNADGSFTFENLENGNYLLALSEDFSFSNEDFVAVVIDGTRPNEINRIVNRLVADNKSKKYDWKISNDSGYSLTEIVFFQNGKLYQTITASQINNNKFSITLDRWKDVTMVVKCLNGENLIVSNRTNIFWGGRETKTFTETEHGNLTVHNFWVIGGGRRMNLSHLKQSHGGGAV